MVFWRTMGVFQRVALATLLAAVLFFLVNLGLGVAQADFDAETIQTGDRTMLSLEQREGRQVYLTPGETASLFDFYPSDLVCEMKDSEGRAIKGHLISNDHRLVDAWNLHWGVKGFEAPRTGVYELSCRDKADRRYPLVLARPSRTKTYAASPPFALFLLVLAAMTFVTSRGVVWLRNRWRSSRSRA